MKKFLVTTAGLIACQPGYAGNWYVGLGLGAAHAEDVSENIAAGNSTLTQNGISNITSSGVLMLDGASSELAGSSLQVLIFFSLIGFSFSFLGVIRW